MEVTFPRSPSPSGAPAPSPPRNTHMGAIDQVFHHKGQAGGAGSKPTRSSKFPSQLMYGARGWSGAVIGNSGTAWLQQLERKLLWKGTLESRKPNQCGAIALGYPCPCVLCPFGLTTPKLPAGMLPQKVGVSVVAPHHPPKLRMHATRRST
jgi:hypothetical protein